MSEEEALQETQETQEAFLEVDLINPDKDEKKIIRKRLLDGETIPGWKLVKGNLGMRLVKKKIPKEKIPKEKIPKEKVPKEKVPKEKVPKIQNISLEDLTRIIGETVDNRLTKTNKRIKKIKKTFDYIIEPDSETEGENQKDETKVEKEPYVEKQRGEPKVEKEPYVEPEVKNEPERCGKGIKPQPAQTSRLSLRDQMKLRSGRK